MRTTPSTTSAPEAVCRISQSGSTLVSASSVDKAAKVKGEAKYAYEQHVQYGNPPPAYAAPFWDEYVAQVEAVPPNVRHLHVHRGHCVWVEPDEERFLTKELLASTCMIGTAEDIAARLRALADAGLTEVMILPSLATKEKVLRDVAALVMPLL